MINSLFAIALIFTLHLKLVVFFIVVDFLRLVSVQLVVLSSILRVGDSTGLEGLSNHLHQDLSPCFMHSSEYKISRWRLLLSSRSIVERAADHPCQVLSSDIIFERLVQTLVYWLQNRGQGSRDNCYINFPLLEICFHLVGQVSSE